MSGTKSKTGKRIEKNGSVLASGTEPRAKSIEVLTLTEAADYLQVAEEEVIRLAHQHEFPGRKIGNRWRFLKAALQDWLRTPVHKSPKEAILGLAGVWKDDPDIENIVCNALERRGRPVTEKPK